MTNIAVSIMNLEHNLNIQYSLDAYTFDNNKYNLNCIHINARSIRNKIDSIECTLRILRMPSVIIISEIFIFESEEKYFNITNYVPYYNSRNDKEGGGVAIFVRKDISSSFVVKYAHSFSSFIVVKLLDLHLNIIGVYKPPNENNNLFLTKLEELISQNQKSILMGDLNINYLDKKDSACKALINMIRSNGFLILNSNSPVYYTRSSNTVKKTIDYAITNCTQFKFKLSVSALSYSDHQLLKLDINTNSIISKNGKKNKL